MFADPDVASSAGMVAGADRIELFPEKDRDDLQRGLAALQDNR